MTTSTNERQIAVIGGGVAGLATAAYLARSGQHVTVFERSHSLGGRAATQTTDGFKINRGVHALYTGGTATEVLQELGVTYTYGVPKQTFALRDGELHALPATPFSLLATTLFDLGDKLEFMRFLAGIGKSKPAAVAHQSIAAWLEGSVHRPRVRGFLDAFARTFAYSTALDKVSAELFVSRLQTTLKHPIHYIDGGWQTLVDGLRNAAQSAGATIRSDARVMCIETGGARARALTLDDGTSIPVSAVVIATEPRDALKLLDGSAALRDAIERLVPVEVACLNVALSKLPDAEHSIVLDVDGSMFMTTQSLYSEVAPKGGALIYAFKQLDLPPSTDARADERDLEALLDRVQPGWRDAVVKREFLPRIAATGALPLASSGGFAGRPRIDASGFDNVLLAGDWLGPDGYLIDAALSTAREAARLTHERLSEARTLVGAA